MTEVKIIFVSVQAKKTIVEKINEVPHFTTTIEATTANLNA